jgi:hypothetical protein
LEIIADQITILEAESSGRYPQGRQSWRRRLPRVNEFVAHFVTASYPILAIADYANPADSVNAIAVEFELIGCHAA